MYLFRRSYAGQSSYETWYRRCRVHKYFPYKHPPVDSSSTVRCYLWLESINFERLPGVPDDNTTTGGAIHGARPRPRDITLNSTWKTMLRHGVEYTPVKWLSDDHPDRESIERGRSSLTVRAAGTSPTKAACFEAAV